MMTFAPSCPRRVLLLAVAFLAVADIGGHAGAVQDLGSRVREQVARLGSEDPKERAAANRELVQLGRQAIPLLQGHGDHPDAEVRGQVLLAIRGIHNTDPFFLVRAPERRVSIDVREASLSQVHGELARAFPTWPSLGTGLKMDQLRGKEKASIRLKVKDASFWEAVRAFSEASEVTLNRDFEFEARRGVEVGYSRPTGAFMPSAVPAENEEQMWIILELNVEPGWHPFFTRFKLTEIAGPDGRSLLEKFRVMEKRGKEEPFLSGNDTAPRVPLGVLHSGRGALAGIPKVRIRGSVSLDVARKIDVIQVRAAGFRGPRDLMLSDCRITLERFTGKEGSYSCDLEFKGPGDYRAPRDEPWKGHIWIFVADDEGHATNQGIRSYGGGGGMVFGGEWPHPTAPTRLVLIRPLEVESLEVPMDIEELSLQPGK